MNNIDKETVRGFGDEWERFGTRLEQRFTKQQIKHMMEEAGLENIQFSLGVPFWCAVGSRKISIETVS